MRSNESVFKSDVLVHRYTEDGKTWIEIWTMDGTKVCSGEINIMPPTEAQKALAPEGQGILLHDREV